MQLPWTRSRDIVTILLGTDVVSTLGSVTVVEAQRTALGIERRFLLTLFVNESIVKKNS